MRWFRSTGLRLLLALGLSFALWVFVSFSENPDQSASFNGVPVDVQGLSSGLVLVDTNGLPRTSLPPVDITVQSDEQTLSRVQSSDFQAFVDLSEVGAGEHVVSVVAEADRSDLAGLAFSQITPSNIAIRLEQLITTTVPITVDVRGNLPFSFERSEPEVRVAGTPISQTMVVGPQGRVAQVQMVQAVAAIEQLRADYTSSVALQPLDANGDLVAGVTLRPDEVNVRVPIRSVAGLRRVAVLGQVTGIPAPGYTISTITSDPQLVNLTGSSGPLDAVNEIETEAIDITGATGAISREVSLLLPPGTSLQVGQPSRVIITVQIEPLRRPFTIRLPVPVQIVNIGGGLVAAPPAPFVQVTLTGADAALAQLGNTPLQATADVAGLGPGSHVITPQLPLPEGVRVVGAVPNVTLTLRALPTATSPPPSQGPPGGQTPQPSAEVPPATITPIAPAPTTTPAAPGETETPPAASARPTEVSTPSPSNPPPPPTAQRSDTTFAPPEPSPTVTTTAAIQ